MAENANSYNRFNQQTNNIASFSNQVTNKGFFSKIMRNLSNYGMDWEDMATSTYGISIYENPNDISNNNSPMGAPAYYDIFTKKAIAKILSRKSIANLDRSYIDKLKILRQYAIKDEIKRLVREVADEAIVYDEDQMFCNIKDLPEGIDDNIKQKYVENFKSIYNAFGFNDGISAWNYFKKLLVDGYIAFEIGYDNKQKEIRELIPLDPITLIPATDPATRTIIWIQYPDNPSMRKILLDSQVIYISYSNNNEYDETSYVENLIRPYNQLKLIEYTRMLYNINHAAIYKKFIVPTNGLTRQQAEQQIYQLMTEYHEDVYFDERMGQVYINGSTAIPHSKDFWFPQDDKGTPDIQIMPFQGVDLNDDVMLNWFYKNFKRASNIPMTRFDEESGGGNLFNDTAEMTRDEIKFSTFIKRLRMIFKEIISKPLKNKMILDFPELENNQLFLNSIKINFNSNDLFEEWKYLNNLSKRSEISSTLNSNLVDAEGKPFLHILFIMKNIMKFTNEQLDENNRYKMFNGDMTTGSGGGGESPQGMPQGGESPQGGSQAQF